MQKEEQWSKKKGEENSEEVMGLELSPLDVFLTHLYVFNWEHECAQVPFRSSIAGYSSNFLSEFTENISWNTVRFGENLDYNVIQKLLRQTEIKI